MLPPRLHHDPLFDRADHWFDRARASLLGVLPCQRGCCRCCVGSFVITILDVDALQAGLAALPSDTRLAIHERAKAQIAAMETAYPRLQHSRDLTGWKDDELDRLAERFADAPCPALAADGSCHVYMFRPLTCRTMGIPVEENGLVQGACEVQTAVPLIKVSSVLRRQEDDLAAQEAEALHTRRKALGRPATHDDVEEVLLAYGFLSE